MDTKTGKYPATFGTAKPIIKPLKLINSRYLGRELLDCKSSNNVVIYNEILHAKCDLFCSTKLVLMYKTYNNSTYAFSTSLKLTICLKLNNSGHTSSLIVAMKFNPIKMLLQKNTYMHNRICTFIYFFTIRCRP